MKTLTIAALAALAALAGCSGGAGGNGSAKADLAADYTRAADALIAKMDGGKTIPAASDPAVKAYDAEADKAMAAIGTDALPADSFDSFDNLCGKGATIIQAYVGSGLPAGADEAARAQAMNANAERYIDQMFTPLLFSARCTAAHLPFIDKSLSQEDVKAKPQALAQIRGGAWGQASGLLEMAADPKLDAPRRKKIMDMLADDAGKFAIVFTTAQREQLSQAAQQAKGQLPANAQGDADRIASELQKAPCGKLCTA
jgi:hypothetical protein